MKNSVFTLLAGMIILCISCNKIDPEVVDSVQASINKVQESRPTLEQAGQNVANLREQMYQAPTGLQISPEFGFGDLMMRVDAFNQRYSSMMDIQAQLQSKLEALLGDYTDGKIKKDAVLKEHESLQAEIESIQTGLDRMTPMFDDLSAAYAKMTATWKSLPEEERTARSVPQQTDGGSPGSLQSPTQVLRPQKSDALINTSRNAQKQ